ncbi:MAG: hypothetical protein ABFC57_08995 [Veillonellales bacterium]
MIKKSHLLFLLICTVFAISSVCWAEINSHSAGNPATTSNQRTIGIFLETPDTYANNETIQNLVVKKATSLFPTNQFVLLPLEATNAAIKSYRPANRPLSLYSAQPLTREDVQSLAKELKCDYALFITLHKGLPSISTDFSSATYKTSITCDIRLLHIQTGKYITTDQITKESGDSTLTGTTTVNDSAYYDALERALMELHIDASRL